MGVGGAWWDQGMAAKAVALVPAAGRGLRLGPGAPKALRELAGEALLVHAVRALLSAESIGQVVVAAPPEELATVRELLPGATVVAGGGTRVASVGLALAAADAAYAVVLVHDAARPLVPASLVDAVTAAVLAGADAVVPALPVTDTIKRVDTDGRVVATVERHDLVAVQTPQGFRRAVLEQAHATARSGVTDDAGLVEALGVVVSTILGHADAMKITRPEDLVFAEAILAARHSA